MSLEFEWDQKKADANLKKHRVAFDEAITVFSDPLARIFDDPDHSSDERREIIIGYRPNHGCCWYPSVNGRHESERSARARHPNANGKPMSKQSERNPTRRDDLRRQYEFDYGESRPNRFASPLGEQTIAVVLEPDVAEVFTSSKSVNRVLRSVMKAAPPRKRRARQSAKRANPRMEPTRR